MSDTVSNAAHTIYSLLLSMETTYPSALKFMEVTAYLLGLYLSVYGVMQLRHNYAGSPKHSNTPYVSLFIGVILLNTPTTISSLVNTFATSPACGGYGQFMDYLSNIDSCSGGSVGILRPVLAFVQVYGFFAFIRGWMLVNRSAKSGSGVESEGLVLKGTVHILFGLACIYIGTIYGVIANFFGFTAPTGF